MTTPKPALLCCKLPRNHSSCKVFKCCFVIISFSCCIDDICQLLQIKQYMRYSCCMFNHNVKTNWMLGAHWQRCSKFKAKDIGYKYGSVHVPSWFVTVRSPYSPNLQTWRVKMYLLSLQLATDGPADASSSTNWRSVDRSGPNKGSLTNTRN